MPVATINGFETAYECYGEGTPTLFIHGGFGGAQTTLAPEPEPAIVEAAPLARVDLITYDRRCAGASEYTLDAAYTLEDLAADARALLAHLGHDRAIIVGSSMGGMVAQQYALSFPETVSALALLNTGPRLMFETPWGQRFTELAARVEAEGAEPVFAEVRERLIDPPPPLISAPGTPLATQQAEARARYLIAVRDLPEAELLRLWRGEVRNYAAFVGIDFTPRLEEIAALEVPKLIVVPFSDGEALRDGLAGGTGDLQFSAIGGADHGIQRYAEAQRVIRDWLERVA